MTAAKAKVGRPKNPLEVAERAELQRIASLASSVLVSARQPGRYVWESERVLRSWLNDDGVSMSTGDLVPALALLEAVGEVGRHAAKRNAPRGGWIATEAEVNGHTSTTQPPESAEGLATPVLGLDTQDVSEARMQAPTAEVLARAIVRSFEMGPGFQGNRALCESESVLRERFAEAGVSYDDATLSAALTMLETASLPASNARLVRGYELHRRNGSRYSPARPLPARAMMLDRVHPFDPTEYSAADIEPYLLPSSAGDSSQSDIGEEQSNAPVMRMVPT